MRIRVLSEAPGKSVPMLAFLCVCFAAVVQSHAATEYVYNNGGTTYDYGFEMSSYQEADDFHFSSLCSVTGARFWTMEGYGIRGDAQPFDGHIDYWIYPSVNGQPGPAAVATGTAQIASRAATGLQEKWWGSMYGFQYVIDLQQPVQVQANTSYFLALHMLNHYPSPDYGEFYWATTDAAVQGAPSYERSGGSGNWSHYRVYGDRDFAFQLYAVSVPEPSTLILFGVGAVSLLAYVWRRRGQTT